jgi:hypothetical protein
VYRSESRARNSAGRGHAAWAPPCSAASNRRRPDSSSASCIVPGFWAAGLRLTTNSIALGAAPRSAVHFTNCARLAEMAICIAAPVVLTTTMTGTPRILPGVMIALAAFSAELGGCSLRPRTTQPSAPCRWTTQAMQAVFTIVAGCCLTTPYRPRLGRRKSRLSHPNSTCYTCRN